jgi:hypothetical protein
MFYIAANHGLIVSTEFFKIWKVANVAYFKLLLQHFPGDTE